VRRRRHPARRRQGRRRLRPARPQRARAGTPLPRLGPGHRPGHRPAPRRPRARRHDQPPAHDLDARRVRGHPRRQVPRRHHRQAGGHGRIARPDRGDGLRHHLHRPRGPQGAGHQARGHDGLRPGLRQRRPARHPALHQARRQGRRGRLLDQNDRASYTYRKKGGVDLEELRAITDRFGGIDKAKAEALGYERLPGDAWIEQDVDILLPCALENQVNAETVKKIGPRVKVLAEGANGPTTPEADEAIKKRGIFVIPDFLANAGGVTCSYFEQVQCNTNFFWPKDEVLTKLDDKMTAAFKAVSELARKKKLYMRDAAYVISVSRVAEACKSRGWV